MKNEFLKLLADAKLDEAVIQRAGTAFDSAVAVAVATKTARLDEQHQERLAAADSFVAGIMNEGRTNNKRAVDDAMNEASEMRDALAVALEKLDESQEIRDALNVALEKLNETQELRDGLSTALVEIAARDRVLSEASVLLLEGKKVVKVKEVDFDNKAEWSASVKNTYPDASIHKNLTGIEKGTILAFNSGDLVGMFSDDKSAGFVRLSPSEQMDEALMSAGAKMRKTTKLDQSLNESTINESAGPIAQALAFMKTGKSSALVKK